MAFDILHSLIVLIVKDLRFVLDFCQPPSCVSLVRATEKNFDECINRLREELKYSLELEGNI